MARQMWCKRPEELDFLEKNQFYCYVQHRKDGSPFYVGEGQGLRCIEYHPYDSFHKKVLAEEGEKNIEVYIFPCASKKEAQQWENELVYMFNCQGYSLVNKASGDGGSKGYRWTEEQKNKKRGKPRSCETKKKISENHNSQPWSEWQLARFRQKTAGHPGYLAKTPEALDNQRNSRRGVKNTPEHNAKITAAKIQRQRNKYNAFIIDTPWGPMGVYDAYEKSGLTHRCFFGRYKKNLSMDKLFSKKPLHSKNSND